MALQALEDRGLIATKRGQVTVLDRAKLEKVAGDSYGVPEAEYARLSSCAADGVGPGLVVQEPARVLPSFCDPCCIDVVRGYLDPVCLVSSKLRGVSRHLTPQYQN